jgi:hypothetical protein
VQSKPNPIFGAELARVGSGQTYILNQPKPTRFFCQVGPGLMVQKLDSVLTALVQKIFLQVDIYENYVTFCHLSFNQ